MFYLLIGALVLQSSPSSRSQPPSVVRNGSSWVDRLSIDVVRKDPRSFDSWDVLEVRQVELFIDDVFRGGMQQQKKKTATTVFHDFMEDYANK